MINKQWFDKVPTYEDTEKAIIGLSTGSLVLAGYVGFGILLGIVYPTFALALAAMMTNEKLSDMVDNASRARFAVFALSMIGIIFGLMYSGLAEEWCTPIIDGIGDLLDAPKETRSYTFPAVNLACTIAVPAALAVTGLVNFAYRQCEGLSQRLAGEQTRSPETARLV